MSDSGTLEYLQNKAASLPLCPGVYIMKDDSDTVIYVGKSRCLKNRVSQYFHGSHDIKTSKMASSVRDFRFITCDTEMEALVLENSLIKQYKPKYNILLKDAKSYPYIKITTDEEYPRIIMTRTRTEDGIYFGPYSNTATIFSVIASVERALGLPSCKKRFPADIGRGRPCVYYQMGRCLGVCTGKVSRDEYTALIDCATHILRGNVGDAVTELESRMTRAAEDERFEEAARCRDSISALRRLGTNQKTALPPDTDIDVIGLASVENIDSASVYYIRSGTIFDTEHFLFGANEITGARNDIGATDNNTDADESDAADNTDDASDDTDTDIESPLSSFIAGLYQSREYIPREILLSFDLPVRDRELIGEYLESRAGHKVVIRTPVRGEMRKLCLMVAADAGRHSENVRRHEQRDERILVSLSAMLGLEVVPERIEAYDISNFGGDNITAGMIVVDKGKFKKSDYRQFKIKSTDTPDDYASMSEALRRRLAHLSDSEGAFSVMPDLILLDGGRGHVSVISDVMRELHLSIPLIGMVKDEHHKTRTLVSETEEISIAREPLVFQFIYKIQEEVHRYTFSRMDSAKRKTYKHSSLEKVQGIGPSKAERLMKHFGTLTAMKKASVEDVAAVPGISKSDAEKLCEYLRNK